MTCSIDSENERLISAPLLITCLCAQWCGVCNQFRPMFEQLSAKYPQLRFAWVDVETFPTVMLSKAREALFLGPVLPQIGVLQRMVESALAQAAPAALKDESAQALLARLLGAKGVELVF